jgi:hypothetical protein
MLPVSQDEKNMPPASGIFHRAENDATMRVYGQTSSLDLFSPAED